MNANRRELVEKELTFKHPKLEWKKAVLQEGISI